MADALAGHVHRPNARREFGWKEHPAGKLVMQTNNLGFREDENTPETSPPTTVRILVTGDSHTDGVVYNHESFPNVLETLLNEDNRRDYEVTNGGVGYYSFHNYEGVLEKYAYLNPDLYIVTVYTGNDFMDVARMLETGMKRPLHRRDDYTSRLGAARKDLGGGTAQALNQVFYLTQFPQMQERVLAEARHRLAKIKARCDDVGIGLLVLLVPTLLDVHPEADQQRLTQALRTLALSEEDLRLNQDLASRLTSWMEAEGIDVIDTGPPLRAADALAFWIRDYHLNTLGHQLIAELVYRQRGEQIKSLRGPDADHQEIR